MIPHLSYKYNQSIFFPCFLKYTTYCLVLVPSLNKCTVPGVPSGSQHCGPDFFSLGDLTAHHGHAVQQSLHISHLPGWNNSGFPRGMCISTNQYWNKNKKVSEVEKRTCNKHDINEKYVFFFSLFFFQYAGYLFVGVGHQEECHLQRTISMTIRMVQLVVGPCVTM